MAGIMIVDNVAFERVSMKDIIVQTGHEVVAEANNGYDVLKTYESTRPDMVIMDIAFPDDDGVEVLKDLLRKHPEAKVCVCTTMAQQAVIIEVIQAGAKDFIVKPYLSERVRESIKKVLG